MNGRANRWIRLAALGLANCALFAGAAAGAERYWPPNTFAVLCYHDIRDEFAERPRSYTVETRQLALQFAWLHHHGYHVVSLDDVVASRREQRPLPDRAVVISFDDGLESVYTRAFPLLEAYHFPAVVGLVGSWLEEPAAGDSTVRYGDENLPHGDFLNQAQIREMQRSGLIEFGSHTYRLHEGVPANPQGNLEPAAVARRFDAARGGYEDAGAYAARVSADIDKSGRDIEQLSGVRPRVVIWPFGARNRMTDRIAAEYAMPLGLTLELGLNTPDVPLSRMRRILITHDFTTADLARVLEEAPRSAPLRVMQVDLDFVYDADPIQQEANLSALLDRVQAMGVNTVFLQAFADPGGTGTAAALYFPNRRLPLRADLFNRVAWQLRTRTGVAVYAWMPLLAFDLPPTDPAHARWVAAADASRRGGVRRLSPFDPEVRDAIREIYADLSTYAQFQGLLFADDATLNELEDASPPAIDVYEQWGLPRDVAAIRADPRLSAEWSRRKIAYLTRFSVELATQVAADHDGLRTARSLFGGVVGDAAAEQRLGQSLSNALPAYDHVALLAMPFLEEHRDRPDRWLAELAGKVAAEPDGLAKTVFELQSVDWARGNQPISGATLAAQIEVLRRAGALNFGYYPDDFRAGRPALDAMRPALSLRSFPANDR